jgi:uncharacterized protein VirK/YbjX
MPQNNPPAPFEFAKQIAARGRMRRAVIFYVNAARAGGAVAQAWLNFVFGELSVLPENLQFGLAQKPFRPYLRRSLKAAERAEILRAHYQMLLHNFTLNAAQELIQQPGKKLATLAGKSGGTYSFYWGLSTTKEGETDFYFYDDQLSAPLATLTGVFDGKNFLIGGLRGIKPPLGRDEIVAATRDLYALRPKHAVLAGVCAAARALGAEFLIAPTQGNHITRKFGINSREILADYDTFWQEFTDARQPDGDYIIPNILPRRDAADVKSKKRTEWLRRMAHLDELALQITDNLNAVAPRNH